MPRRLANDEAAAFMHHAGAEPLDPYPGASRPWRCRCLRCGRQITPRLDNVRTGCGPCRYCSGQGVDPGEATAVMRLAGLEPLDPYPGAVKPWRCRCAGCGSEVHPRYASVRKGHGCRHCGTKASSEARRMNRGDSALDHRSAIALMLDNGLRPLEPFRSAGRPWRWRCTACGGQVVIRLTSVSPGEKGCQRCAMSRTRDGRHRAHTAEVVPVDAAAGPVAGDTWAAVPRTTTAPRRPEARPTPRDASFAGRGHANAAVCGRVEVGTSRTGPGRAGGSDGVVSPRRSTTSGRRQAVVSNP